MKMKNLKRLIFACSTATLFVACGGDSSPQTNPTENPTQTPSPSSTPSPTTTPPPASNNCVTIPRHTTGMNYTLKVTDIVNDIITNVETTVTSDSSTSLSFATEMSGSVSATGTKTQTFTTANNYMDITKIVSEDTTTVQGTTIDTDTTLTISPFMRVAIDEVCEGQAWTTEYTLDAEVTILGQTSSNTSTHSTSYTIEMINESKTVGQETYTTVKMTSISEGETSTTWTDAATGLVVYVEVQDSTGTLISTQELL